MQESSDCKFNNFYNHVINKSINFKIAYKVTENSIIDINYIYISSKVQIVQNNGKVTLRLYKLQRHSRLKKVQNTNQKIPNQTYRR